MGRQTSFEKLRGGYYTPKKIADFLSRWAIISKDARILEPSCGNGIFLESAIEALVDLGCNKESLPDRILGIEIDPKETHKAQKHLRSLGVSSPNMMIHNGDFFTYCKSDLFDKKSFDVVIGNPPFIRYQNFPKEYREIAISLMRKIGLNPNRYTNTWVPFLVISTFLLKKSGRLGMVVPAELFEVNYAAETRNFLHEVYGELTIITFRRLVFHGIQQEVILLLGVKNRDGSGKISIIELEDVTGLVVDKHSTRIESLRSTINEFKPIANSFEKWTQYFLNNEEISFLRDLRKNEQLTLTGELFEVDIGVVTGRNKFFVLNNEQMEKYSLKPYTKRIVTRSAHLRGAIFREKDWIDNVRSKHGAHLFMPGDLPFQKLPQNVREYILRGEEMNIHRGYKCRIRKRWYVVPSVWEPDAFMLRQVHDFPKLVLNKAEATCTDTIHRVRLLNKKDGERITATFLNSLTFAFSEITGRSYGGGVLTFEPTEAERLPLPFVGADNLDLHKIDKLLRLGKIYEILEINDEILLSEGLGLDWKDISMLRNMWEKLRDRRMNRKHN